MVRLSNIAKHLCRNEGCWMLARFRQWRVVKKLIMFGINYFRLWGIHGFAFFICILNIGYLLNIWKCSSPALFKRKIRSSDWQFETSTFRLTVCLSNDSNHFRSPQQLGPVFKKKCILNVCPRKLDRTKNRLNIFVVVSIECLLLNRLFRSSKPFQNSSSQPSHTSTLRWRYATGFRMYVSCKGSHCGHYRPIYSNHIRIFFLLLIIGYIFN